MTTPSGESPPGPAPELPGRGSARRYLFAIVLAGVLAHSYRITNPLFDKHPYRQFDTAAVARNYVDSGMRFLYPQVDWRGSGPGYVEVEFPAYNYATALVQSIVGPHDWTGRAVSILCYALSAVLLFLLVRRIFDERAALFAALFYSLLPFTLFHTRTVQPDAMLALGSIAGIYYFWTWTEDEHWWRLGLAWAGVTLAALIKPPSLYLAIPLGYLAIRAYGLRAFARPALWIFALAVPAAVALWYAHSYRLWVDYGNTYGIIGTTPQQGLWSPVDRRWLSLARTLLFERMTMTYVTPLGVVFLAAGALSRQNERGRVLLWWLAGFAVFVVLLPNAHLGHDYYQLPIAFVVMAYMGRGVTVLLDHGVFSRRVTIGLTAFVLLWSAYGILPWYEISDGSMRRTEFAKVVAELTEPGDLIIFVDPTPLAEADDTSIYRHRTPDGDRLWANPIDFYNADRNGWSLHDHQATPERVERLRADGARILAAYHGDVVFARRPELLEMLDRDHSRVAASGPWAIYRLDSGGGEPGGGGEGSTRGP